MGFEPGASRSRTVRSTKLSYTLFSREDRSRTCVLVLPRHAATPPGPLPDFDFHSAIHTPNFRLFRVPATGVEPVPPRFSTQAASTELASPGNHRSAGGGNRTHNCPFKRRGLCLLSYTSKFRGLESNQRPPASKAGNGTSTESPGMNFDQLPRQESNQRRPPSEGGNSTSTESPASWHWLPAGVLQSAAVVGIEPTNYALTERRLTIRLHTAVCVGLTVRKRIEAERPLR